MVNKLSTGLLLLTLVGTETIAQYFLQKYVNSSFLYSFAFGVILYGMVAILYTYILHAYKHKSNGLTYSNIVWNTGTTVTVTFVGWMIFQQSLTKLQTLGIFVTILGVILVGQTKF
tara:strand:+ start:60 stop:407 length:348 start_codon:yes stop_codon:yes gene_type:complete